MKKFRNICGILIIMTCVCSLIRVGYSIFPIFIIIIKSFSILIDNTNLFNGNCFNKFRIVNYKFNGYSFANKFRIVSDSYNGYEVQIKRWWSPFYVQCWKNGQINSFRTLNDAKDWIKMGRPKYKFKSKVIEIL